MAPSVEFFIILAALAAMWLSLRADIRALTAELRRLEGDPDRDIEFDKALAAVSRAIGEPVSPRELVRESHLVRETNGPAS